MTPLEWCRECQDEVFDDPCGTRSAADIASAIVIIWGKLLPPEALGPRCYDHAAKWVDMARLDQWAVFDLRGLVRP